MSPEFAKLLELMSGGGSYVLATVFAYLYWSEREERRALNLKVDAMLERCINAINGSANAVNDVRVYLGIKRNEGN
jgi:hypothetical protein